MSNKKQFGKFGTPPSVNFFTSEDDDTSEANEHKIEKNNSDEDLAERIRRHVSIQNDGNSGILSKF